MKTCANDGLFGVQSRSLGQRERGLTLLEVLLFMAVLSGLVLAGYLAWRDRTAIESSRQEKAALAQADRAVQTFATVIRRLPCPDTNRDGTEDCGGGVQKGWLPTVSLSMAGADPGVGVAQLQYLVQRGQSEFDLAVLDDSWRPLEYDDSVPTFEAMRETSGADAYQAGILTLTDFCQRLDEGIKGSFASGLAAVRSSPQRLVAYALVHPGMVDSDGDGSLFDDGNVADTNEVEDPDKSPILSRYDDAVLERSFDSLRAAFHCNPLARSIDSVSLGLDVIAQVDDMREGNIDAAERAVAFAALGAAMTGVELAAAAIEAASDGGNAAAEFAACAASLGIAVNFCSAAGMHVGSSVTAGISAGLNAGSIAANVTAAVMAGNALVLADNSKPPSSVSCPGVDVSEALATSLKERDDARAAVTEAQTKLAAKRTELAQANAIKTSATNALYTALRFGKTASALDNLIAQLVSSTDTRATRSVEYEKAKAEREGYQKAYNSWNDMVTKYANMIANRTTLISSLEAEIATLDAQIAATTDSAAKLALQKQRMEKSADLTLLKNPTALQKEHDDAVANRNTAATDLATAQINEAAALAAMQNADASYQSAYAGLNNGSLGPYNIQDGLAVIVACTPRPGVTCPQDAVSTSANVANALIGLMGIPPVDSGATQAHEDSAFLKPKKLEREVAALEKQVEDLQKRVKAAEDNYNDLLSKTANPPACTLSGSGVTPLSSASADDLLINTDVKGGTR